MRRVLTSARIRSAVVCGIACLINAGRGHAEMRICAQGADRINTSLARIE